MIGVAAVAFLANAASVLLLHSGAGSNINIRSAFLHMLTDALMSFGVLILGCIWLFYPWYWLDSPAALIIVAIIFYNGWHILKEAVSILMNAAPPLIDINLVKSELEAIEGILSIHHLHIWKMSSDISALSAHVIVTDQMLSNLENLADKIIKKVKCDFNIAHPTLQFECRPYE